MKRFSTGVAIVSIAIIGAIGTQAQSIVPAGGGSMASQPPNYGGYGDAIKMLTRNIYCDERPSKIVDGLEIPGRPIPTNDWWTDVINNQYSGALWSYPAMVNTGEAGVEVCYPGYWADAGKEMKSRSSVTVGGAKYKADATIAKDWGDWNVVVRMPQKNGIGSMQVTLAHGMPFTWFEFRAMTPVLTFNSRAVDTAVETAYPADTAPVLFGKTDTYCGVKYGKEIYGFYFPKGTGFRVDGKTIQLSENTEWLVVALLGSEGDLADYDKYAVCVPRNTEVGWSYDEGRAVINTTWDVNAENLRGGNAINVLQGFLPHAYKHAMAGANLPFTGKEYATPRGKMKMAASTSGKFGYSYQFNGMMPAYAAPKAGDSQTYGYDQSIMDALMKKYADEGTFGGDTYWGGKGLTQMALNMTFAKQTGNTEVYESSKKKLREIFENWLTYKPGEDNYYFSYFKRWGGMLGIAVSYGSDTFNDHHFHYGYFTYAAALLCMEDKDFAEKYGEILTLIAKDFANWDREDGRFPFLRTLDPWSGHSWAGGLGDAGNDNGNGQESTSEAMQGWGGVYLLGVALDNKEMRDAGLFGWNTEARATREYWFDVDQPRPANAGGRVAWPGKNNKDGQYDYNLYPYAYNSNITCKGIGWWTWFGGDPLFMHGIQWMPISPALDYLSWDPDFVNWAYNDMMSGANSTYTHDWFEETVNTADNSTIEPLAKNDWGNVTLAYLQRCNPELAAEIFKKAYDQKLHIANSVSTAHISYYTTHNTLTYGLPDRNYHADCPTATVFTKEGKQTYMAYNPGDEDLTVKFYDANGAVVKTVTVAPGSLTAFDKGDPVATSMVVESSTGEYVAPGAGTTLTAKVLDQYGAQIKGVNVAYSLPAGAKATISGNALNINADAVRGTTMTVTATAGSVTSQFQIIVNDRPTPRTTRIEGIEKNPQDVIATYEVGTVLNMSLHFVDQYGKDNEVSDAVWILESATGDRQTIKPEYTSVRPGVYTITAKSADAAVSATEKVFITPLLGKLTDKDSKAVSSSEENAGSQTAGAIDGDNGTRWGSQHTDSEWIYVDLGSEKFVSRVGIIWEAAFASEYEIQLAPEGCEMADHTGNYMGTSKTVKVPVESAWTTSVTQTQSSFQANKEITTRVNATGRYVRMKGVKRGSAYGYSLYEMNIYGLDGSIGPDDLLGIDFSMPEALSEGETYAIQPVAYTRSGNVVKNVGLNWKSDKDATFNGNKFTPTSHGMYTLTATTDDGMTSTGTVFVYESAKLKSLSLSGEEFSMLSGDRVVIDFSGLDQFDAVYEIADDEVEVTIYDADNNMVGGNSSRAMGDATYSIPSRSFRSNVPGVYTLKFDVNGVQKEAKVTVNSLADANLALGKVATASGVAEGNVAGNVNDGKMNTRWGSEWGVNGTWISVDLENAYMVNRFKLYWEGAYAKKFHIETSLDGDSWETVYNDTKTNADSDEITLTTPVAARYVKLVSDERAMEAYGTSLYEFEIFGESKFEYDDHKGPEFTQFDVTSGDGSINVVVAANDQSETFDIAIEVRDSNGALKGSYKAQTTSGEPVSHLFKNLEEGNYTVIVTGTDSYGNTSMVTDAGVTIGLSTIITEIDEAEEVEERWYDMNGCRVENPRGGMFVRVRGNKAQVFMIP